MRECNLCHEVFLLEGFNKEKTGPQGYSVRCKLCRSRQARAFRANNPEHVRARDKKSYERNKATKIACMRKYQEANKEALKVKGRNWYLLANYGLDSEQYAAMNAAQAGGCAVCGRSNQTGKLLIVDHDHDTGAVRGLLCFKCNVVLGHVDDSPERLKALADYLIEHAKQLSHDATPALPATPEGTY